MNKSGRVFSALPIDQTHEQLNAVVKHDGGVIGLTDNDTTLGRYVVSARQQLPVLLLNLNQTCSRVFRAKILCRPL